MHRTDALASARQSPWYEIRATSVTTVDTSNLPATTPRRLAALDTPLWGPLAGAAGRVDGGDPGSDLRASTRAELGTDVLQVRAGGPYGDL